MSYQVLKDRGLDSAWDLDDFVKTCKTCKVRVSEYFLFPN